MPRDVPVSNGNLLVSFDLSYRIRDIYFPWVGQENHTRGQEFRLGVWADGQFSWLGAGWKKDIRYRDDSLVTEVRLESEELGLRLECSDAVDFQLDVYVRQIEVVDLSGAPRDVRLFFSHDFHLHGHELSDTAFFDPRTKSIVHYKHNRYFLVNCCAAGTAVADYFSCGTKDASGKRASWKGAEEGSLAGNAVAWGVAESTVGARLAVPSGGSALAFHWLAAGTRYDEVRALSERVVESSPAELIRRTAGYWKAWVDKAERPLCDLPRSITDVFSRSLLVLRSQIDNRGAIIAANDSDIVRFGGDTYSYMWGRDGAFVAVALDRAGYGELCRQFFKFCARALSEGGYLFQHYYPDGTIASNWHPWVLGGKEVLPIQEDSTALLLWALWIHYEHSNDIEFIRPLYERLVLRCADFLVAYRDPETGLPTPSFDLWEERYGVHAYTVAAVIAGLRGAARFARVFHDLSRAALYDGVATDMERGLEEHLYHPGLGRYARSGYRTADGYDLDEVIDVSLLGLVTLGAMKANDARIVATVDALRRELSVRTSIGGVARYQNDQYQRDTDVPADLPGNPWFIATLWLGEYEIEKAETLEELRRAVPYLEWCADNALPSGVLAEQVHPIEGAPLSVSPLTWSHSAFVWAVRAYSDKYRTLQG